MNRALVAKTIQKNKQVSRAEISRQTGLNKATVTNIVAELISRGTVREIGLLSGESGRRSIGLEIAAEKFLIIGVWVTRRHLRIGLLDINGTLICMDKLAGGLSDTPDKFLDVLCAKVEEILGAGHEGRILGMSIALPGPYLKEEGRFAFIADKGEWQDVDILSAVRERTGLFVYGEHDVDAFAMAEWCFTENYNENASMCCLMVGQTVGGGIIEDGRLLRGRRGIAGEIGHMSIDFNGPLCACGNHGCLEVYCSTLTLLEKMKERLGDWPDTVCRADMSDAQLMDACREGDALAVSLMEEAGSYLACGIANIVKIFNPEQVVIGDEYARAGDAFLEYVREETFRRLFPGFYKKTQIRMSTLSDPVLRGLAVSFMEYAADHADDFFGPQSA